jgi:competence protein ComEC
VEEPAALTGSLPPVVRLALAFAGGAALAFLPGRISLPALLATLWALAPIPASPSPRIRGALTIALVAGCLAGAARRDAVGAPPPRAEGGWVGAWRERLAERFDTLYGTRAPIVAALTLAETGELDATLREDFARSGTTHLLSISGFHVAVVAGLLLALLRALGASRRSADLGAACAAWLYVGLLGFPPVAARAALMLTAVAGSRARGRPPARWGGLGLAFLALVALDPALLASPGFQLSFAGTAGLVAWFAPMRAWLKARLPRRAPEALLEGLAAGCAATLATTPIVAWHFERVSIVGIPATLLVTPCVVLALPGALASLAAHALHPAAGRFLAGGVALALDGLAQGAHAMAAPPWASVWVPRAWVSVGLVGAVVGVALAGTMRGRARQAVIAAGAAAALVAWPGLLALQARGTAEILMVDVGQGDAIALRSPGGRWLLVDAGPPWEGDPGASPVVRTLRGRGVRRLEALVLTHPDLDHIGGAAAVLAALPVAEILDPGVPAGKGPYVDLLERAMERGIPWRAAGAGDRRAWDGLEVRVLHPGAVSLDPGEGDTGANDVSVVLAVAYGDFDALLTGDAPTAVERELLHEVRAPLEVLKVGHHGSPTSTDPALLAHAPPALALVSAGRRNRYGHPDPLVVRRLEASGALVRRTDQEGTLSVLGRRDGAWTVRASGRGGR